ncbi:hypothetical protein BC937DRAFT_91928 [Endogone sp. FLAS-F59071]|nr:hypothetical protein BC937DRAFT_91928 [Endogone sp. FLAS-F59071]|eukprot:RUS21656.1 hypothetical protein BC937DRAFT_91928 [Endogone sp. FLAS-F59071]
MSDTLPFCPAPAMPLQTPTAADKKLPFIPTANLSPRFNTTATPSPNHPLDDVNLFESPFHSHRPRTVGTASDPSLRSPLSQTLTLGRGESLSRSEGQASFDLEDAVTPILVEREQNTKSREKKVIVHKVQATDTLAGVALFYGIDVCIPPPLLPYLLVLGQISTLKKVNKLWSNDSIHMRSELFIPLDDCTVLHEDGTVTVDDSISRVTIVKKRQTYSVSSGDLGAQISRSSSPSFDQHLSNNTGTVSAAALFALPASSFTESMGLPTPPIASISHSHPHPHRSNSASASYQLSSSPHARSSSPSTRITTTITTASIQSLPVAQLTFFPPASAPSINSGSSTIKHRGTHAAVAPLSQSSATSSPRPSDESSSRSSASSTTSTGSLPKAKGAAGRQAPPRGVSAMETILERLDTCGIPVYRARRRDVDERSSDGKGKGSVEEDGVTWFRL